MTFQITNVTDDKIETHCSKVYNIEFHKNLPLIKTFLNLELTLISAHLSYNFDHNLTNWYSYLT